MKFDERCIIFALLLGCVPVSADARVIFTGYGDLRYNAGLDAKISGTPASLTALGTTPSEFTTRSFNADAVGLFATTQVQDNVQFLTNFTFRNIGTQVGQLSMQYVYMEWTPWKDTAIKGGKVTLPFGYYNENRFYPFQRYTINAPIFQSGILGLPIADWGAVAQQRFPTAPFTFEASAYMVNGYGNAGTNGNAFRLATLPGGLSIANNLRASDNNHQPSLGGRLRLTEIGGMPVETGVSYIWGYWDKSGLEPMYLADEHIHAKLGGLDLLTEYIEMGVRGDQGFVNSIGATNYSTDGGFVTVSYDALQIKGKVVAPYVQTEYYRTHPNDGNANRETLRSFIAGSALRASEAILFKAEYINFIYELPDSIHSGVVRLDANGVQLSMVVTF